MLKVPSVMRLHLSYRLWIAEMNSDINILRIFDDYIMELSTKKEPEIKSGIDHFKKEFISIRKEIDELRHEMHLNKMDLSAFAREGKNFDQKTYQDGHHADLEKRYIAFRKMFDKSKAEFSEFEAKWLS